jgi:hypothetical protein
MKMETKRAWYNFRTEKHDWFCGDPENPKDYISQHPAAQGLFHVLIEMGKSEQEAMLHVLTVQVGETP